MQTQKKYDVIIVGSGITGLSTALHLHAAGITNIALCSPGSERPGSQKSSGLITGGQIDNFTRFSHNYGNEFAANLWRFGDRSFSHLRAFCESIQVPVKSGRRLRLITSAPELREAEIAVKQLHEQGLPASLETRTDGLPPYLTERILAVQSDGAGGAWIDIGALMTALTTSVKADRIGKLSSLKSKQGSLSIHTDKGSFTSEIVVLACHLATGDYLPELRAALISVADQWSVLPVVAPPPFSDQEVLVYSANHTYEWGAAVADRVIVGGGRYLRKHAGIEATTAEFFPNIETHLVKQLGATFSGIKTGTTLLQTAALDCRPCDELPIIGPMFGDSRIFVATGYMGNGLAMGFYAGHCLTELINKGRSDSVPRRLFPERLRSLEG